MGGGSDRAFGAAPPTASPMRKSTALRASRCATASEQRAATKPALATRARASRARRRRAASPGSCEELECAPNERFCEGDVVRKCAGSGLSSTEVTTCASHEYCDAASATCKTGVCSPGSRLATGRKPRPATPAAPTSKRAGKPARLPRRARVEPASRTSASLTRPSVRARTSRHAQWRAELQPERDVRRPNVRRGRRRGEL